MKKFIESGHSNLEAMAATLIIVILSIIGVICYYYILDKHDAEEILNKASHRALEISTQIQANKKMSMENFEEDRDIFIGLEKQNKSQFKIILSEIEDKTCLKMKDLARGISALQFVADDCSFLVYNNNYSTTKVPFCPAGNFVSQNKCLPCSMGDTTCGCQGDDKYADGRGGCGHYVENFTDKTLTSRLADVCCKTGYDLAINGKCFVETELY